MADFLSFSSLGILISQATCCALAPLDPAPWLAPRSEPVSEPCWLWRRVGEAVT